jgi:hypothetical protein
MKSSSKQLPQFDPTSFRFGQRSDLEVPVQLSVAGRALGRGTIRNASVSGALIETALDLPLHTNVVVTLTMPHGNTSTARELTACVVRLDMAGIGVEWRDMGSVDITDLLSRASSNLPGLRDKPHPD